MRKLVIFPAILLCASLAACKQQPKPASVEAPVKFMDTLDPRAPEAPKSHGPDNHGHALRGTVDSVNTVTLDGLAKLGIDEARKQYLGKIVTFRDLTPVGIRAKNEDRQNVCMQGFVKHFHPRIAKTQVGSLRVYFNFDTEISEWLKHVSYLPKHLQTENLLVLNEDVCDTAIVCQEGDVDGDRKCIFSSDILLISGKVVAISMESGDRELEVVLRPTGIRY